MSSVQGLWKNTIFFLSTVLVGCDGNQDAGVTADPVVREQTETAQVVQPQAEFISSTMDHGQLPAPIVSTGHSAHGHVVTAGMEHVQHQQHIIAMQATEQPTHGHHTEHMHGVSGSSDNIAGIHIQMTSDQGHYQVRVKSELDPIVINRVHSWTLNLKTTSGEPVENAQITVNGGMPAHKHGLPTAPEVTEYLGEGDYLVEGLMFQMPGHWQVGFDISADAVTDRVTFDFVLE